MLRISSLSSTSPFLPYNLITTNNNFRRQKFYPSGRINNILLFLIIDHRDLLLSSTTPPPPTTPIIIIDDYSHQSNLIDDVTKEATTRIDCKRSGDLSLYERKLLRRSVCVASKADDEPPSSAQLLRASNQTRNPFFGQKKNNHVVDGPQNSSTNMTLQRDVIGLNRIMTANHRRL